MDQEDWWEIVQLIQAELRSIGHDDIADLSNYELREGTERRLPFPQELVKELLEALRREISARSSATLKDSLTNLGRLIDEGERPEYALVWLDEERALVEGRERPERLEGIADAPRIAEELEFLIRGLGDTGKSGDVQ